MQTFVSFLLRENYKLFFFLAKHTKTVPKLTLRTEEETFTPAFINNQQAETVSSSK